MLLYAKWKGVRQAGLPYIRLPKTPNLYIFTLKMANAIFAETFDNFQNSTRIIPKAEVLH
jgi:hypothetical protein